MAKLRGTDILTVLRGLNAVSRAAANVTEAELKEAWTSSSTVSGLRNLKINYKPENFPQQVKEAAERSFAVVSGLKAFSLISAQRLIPSNADQSNFQSYNESQPAAAEFSYPNNGIDSVNSVLHESIPLEKSANNKDAYSDAVVDHVTDAEPVEKICSRKSETVNGPTTVDDTITPSKENNMRNFSENCMGNNSINILETNSLSPVSEQVGVDLNKSNTQEDLSTSASILRLVKSEVLPSAVNASSSCMENAKIDGSSSETEATKSWNETGKITDREPATQQGNAAKSDSDYPEVKHVISETEKRQIPQEPVSSPVPPVARKNRVSKLSETSREISVPSSRIGRLASYGSLAAGLGIGALAEITRRTLGLNEKNKTDGSKPAILDSNPFLTEANAERIVNTLCKVRGAALKLGQMLSIQDNSLINPQLQKIFERVRQSADFMPARQMESVLIGELGSDWRSKLLDFQDKPFAAASVGQVHLATLLDGREVAMKIQYPGVAKGIESDINNLVAVMNVWNILPKGMYIEEFVEVAKRELSWEVDYVREAECTKRFKGLVKDIPDFKVPDVIDELCTSQIFTSEFVEGISMEQCMELDQDTRNFVAEKILTLCLTELFEFRFMQTDPNWANFMYNPTTRQIVLIDFGASRDYSKEFVDKYIRVIEGAAEGDRQKVLEYSQALGFLVGYESKAMEEAHVDAVMILGEAFRFDKPFDFGQQDTTRRIQRLIPVMLSQRLCPPPQESYSLHRKMSGAFLLCTKLRANINCKQFFNEITEKYHALGNS